MYLRVDKDSSLFKLHTHFLAAYERRTDVMEASTDLSIQRKIDALTKQVSAETNDLQQAVDSAKE